MRRIIVAVLAICLALGFGYWILHKAGSHAKSSAVDAARIRGKVKWFNEGKGYGFISQEGGPDVFVHYTSIQSGDKSLHESDDVEFELVHGPKGWEARNVVKVSKPTGQ